MTHKEYQERFDQLYYRMQLSLRLRHYLCVKARLRDIAHLEHEIRPSVPYKVLYDKLLNKYLPPTKISN